MVVGVLLTQLYTLRFILKVILGAISHQPLGGRHDHDLPTNSAILILLLPALRGGMGLLSLIAHQLRMALTPPESKVFVVGLLGVALLLRGALYSREVSRAPAGAPLFRMWLLPGLRGQWALPLGRSGDGLQKVLGLGFTDLI